MLKIIKKYSLLAMFMIGSASGYRALQAAENAKPPIEWSTIPFVFFGSAFAMLWIIGIQMFRKKPDLALLAIKFFRLICVFLFGAGTCSILISLTAPGFRATEFFFAAIGIGIWTGLVFCKGIIRLRYKTEL